MIRSFTVVRYMANADPVIMHKICAWSTISSSGPGGFEPYND